MLKWTIGNSLPDRLGEASSEVVEVKLWRPLEDGRQGTVEAVLKFKEKKNALKIQNLLLSF